GRLLFTERRGSVKLYEPGSAQARVVAEFEVDASGESGLLGLALDPGFEENGWLYLLATRKAEAGKPRRHRVSRFTYDLIEKSLDLASEKPLLEVPLESLERGSSAHAGGALAISETGDLFIATGDDTRIDASGGFAPIDPRPGRAAYDAARSAGNTDDLRGKVLRIRSNLTGNVEIPSGNLFGREGSYAGQGRPEIYAMGFRNPFTLVRDPADGALYVGGPGPDAGRRDPARGPAGVDEVNRIEAGNPGNFGWPFFAGEGLPYPVEGGSAGTVEAPRNDSPHNTGAKTLPAARPPLLSFGYATSREHPELGKGPRSVWVGAAMARPAGQSGTRILLGDFMRQTLHWVDLGSGERIERIERIAPEIEWNNPINGTVAADGTVYVLEYGAGWYSGNSDAQLSRLVPSQELRSEAPAPNFGASELPASLSVEIGPNRSFFTRDPSHYRVDAAGEESGAVARVAVSLHELGSWNVLRSRRRSEGESSDAGWSEHGCVSCHAEASPSTSIAPSRRDLGLRYADADPQTVERLIEKIRIGGAGSFGERAMPPHPGLDRTTRLRLVQWLLGIGRARELRRDLPLEGDFVLPVSEGPSSRMPRGAADGRMFVLRAEFDGERVERVVRAPHFPAAAFSDSAGAERTAVAGFSGEGVVAHEEGAWLRYAGLDLRGFSEVSLWLSGGAEATGAILEVHFDAPDGPILGEVSTLRFSEGGLTEVSLSLTASANAKANADAGRDLFLVFRRGRAMSDYVLLSIDFH
ncbi:MAG: PQQ-dependent sugar dehydrogenase, partial [Myxococcota bacterium]|nr:PQQ-dependent sugar dehydrogenase [Myxococcota bacterium]